MLCERQLTKRHIDGAQNMGGGATNTDPNDYAKNWLHFLFVGVGASYDLVPPK